MNRAILAPHADVCSIPSEVRREEAAKAKGVLGYREIHLPCSDLHQVHIAVYEAGMRAARTSMKESHWIAALPVPHLREGT